MGKRVFNGEVEVLMMFGHKIHNGFETSGGIHEKLEFPLQDKSLDKKNKKIISPKMMTTKFQI